jgi:hypothetical protein
VNRPTRTNEKALAINLDMGRYGSFAEIGAGQEVARWFYRVGGAAGTIAKSVSAYDKTVSDAIYGPTHRYVVRERLEEMIRYEQPFSPLPTRCRPVPIGVTMSVMAGLG